MKLFYLLVICGLAGASGCSGVPENSSSNDTQTSKPVVKKRPVALDNGKIFEKDGKKLLYGGKDSTWHFDISNSFLVDSQYHYGIGRERFHALIKPEYITLTQADSIYPDSARFLLLNINNDVRAYGIDLLTHHEIVNDVVGGQPIMAAYCILADLGAIYKRTIDDRTYTFALSGYTYYDPEVWDGMDGFVFWDRETESTWWPLIGKAVSGPMIHTPLEVYEDDNWSQTTWAEIKTNYQKVQVLKPGQRMDPPTSWPKYNVKESGQVKEAQVAPRWGENKAIEG